MRNRRDFPAQWDGTSTRPEPDVRWMDRWAVTALLAVTSILWLMTIAQTVGLRG